jgi:predicted AlkP superfamily phosphohydrolase/phosphomutase
LGIPFSLEKCFKFAYYKCLSLEKWDMERVGSSNRVFIIGLDCATPQFVFDSFGERLPNFKYLIEEGIWGEIETIIPPITVPAWASMFSGKLPGKLGFYGFRNRRDYTYEGLSIVSSKSWKERAVWDFIADEGFKSIVVGVPPSYPPKPIEGIMISCFLTPGPESQYSHPVSLKEEIEKNFGKYIFDVENFRTEDKENLLSQIYEMTNQRFEIVKFLMNSMDWNLFIFVEMGPDRLHHGFWKFFDPQHPKYERGNPFENVAFEYYSFLDRKIGELLKLLDDDTTVIIVSDHGAKRMEGGICINEWLIKEGYLRLKGVTGTPRRIEMKDIDWSRTIAWGEGGYYGRIFLNVKDREPEGTIPLSRFDEYRNELIESLEALPDEYGNPIGTKAYKPEEIYPEIKGIPPDLIVLFGDLYWRSVGSVGFNTVWVHENDTGPDDANHSLHGVFIMKGPGTRNLRGEVRGVKIVDIAPTLLDIFGVATGENFDGKSIFEREEE